MFEVVGTQDSNVRRLSALFALCVAVLCGTVRAADWKDWFDAGIRSGWPNSQSMYGGTWCEDAEKRGKMLDERTLQISSDEDDPLAFMAEDPKPLGSNDSATNVLVSFSCAFQPCCLSTLPAVPTEAKGAVILVTEEEDPDETTGGELYYAAYDPDSGTNGWRPSGVMAKAEDFIDVSMLISHGDSGFVEVQYTIKGSVTETVAIRQSNALVRDVVYAGSGKTCELRSECRRVDPYRIGETEYENFTDMNNALRDGDTVVVQLNDTLPAGATLTNLVTFSLGRNALSTLSGEDLTIARDVVFKAKSAGGVRYLAFFVRADRTLTLPSGTMFDLLSGEDFACVNIGGEWWVRYNGQWVEMDLVEMYFYYPGYFNVDPKVFPGPFGGLILGDVWDEYLNDVAMSDYYQGFYWDAETERSIDFVYWFDGSWTWVYGGKTAVTNQSPTHYMSGSFYPNSTAIVYRIAYDMGEVPDATHANPTGYSIDTRFSLGAAVAPAGSTFVFQGWTNETGGVVTTVDPIALGLESGSLANLTLYASWGSEPPAHSALFTVVPGKLAAYYDTSKMATDAVAAFNADKAGRIQAPTGFNGSVANYATNFEAAAKDTALSVVLTDVARESILKRIDGDVSAAESLASPVARKVTLSAAEPGFYYMILGGTEAGVVSKEGTRVLAQEPTVELWKPLLDESGKAFFKIGAAVKP